VSITAFQDTANTLSLFYCPGDHHC